MAIDCAKSVLLVEDSKTIAQIVRTQLSQIGFRDVDLVTDGHEALTKMSGKRYGLVISDWHMAPTNGLELLQQVKADEGLKHTPFVMVSAEEAPENVAAAKSAGAAAYVIKPFDALTLKARIESALRAA